jgi:succinate dehydrogenase hydrophobic anchor subunit
MGEIRRLRPAESPTTAVTETKWGSPQRFLVLGITLIVLAAIVAAVLGYMQYTTDIAVAEWIQAQRDYVHRLRPWGAIQWYRSHLVPGIESVLDERFQGRREMMGVGIVIAGLTGIAGVVFAVVGVVGLSGRKPR